MECGEMRKQFKFYILAVSAVLALGLTACNQTPVQKALASDPDRFAQAVNDNIEGSGEFVSISDCIHVAYDASYMNQINKANAYANTPEIVNQNCHHIFKILAENLNDQSEFKNLTAEDFIQTRIWDHYYQSKQSKFHFKKH
jgi:hypothetical protein